MDFQAIQEWLRATYLEENPYQKWAWALSVLFVFWFPPSTRRLAVITWFIVLGLMGLFFGMASVYQQYTPGGR